MVATAYATATATLTSYTHTHTSYLRDSCESCFRRIFTHSCLCLRVPLPLPCFFNLTYFNFMQ